MNESVQERPLPPRVRNFLQKLDEASPEDLLRVNYDRVLQWPRYLDFIKGFKPLEVMDAVVQAHSIVLKKTNNNQTACVAALAVLGIFAEIGGNDSRTQRGAIEAFEVQFGDI